MQITHMKWMQVKGEVKAAVVKKQEPISMYLTPLSNYVHNIGFTYLCYVCPD